MLELCRCPNIYGPDCNLESAKTDTELRNEILLQFYGFPRNEPSRQAYLYSLHMWGLYDRGLGCLDDTVNLHRLPIGQLNKGHSGPSG